MYGGTKTEAARLIEDAEKLDKTFTAQRDSTGELTMSLNDMYTAIHIVQQQMGITGTTAKEAGDTISGSIGQLGAAWENLVAGFADPKADISKLITDVVDTAEVSFKNLMPTVENAITGVAGFVERVAPIIADRLPEVADELIPPVLSTAETVVNALVNSLPSALGSVVSIAPEIITNLSQGIIQQTPKVMALGKDLIIGLANGISNSLPELSTAAVGAVSEIATELTKPGTLKEVVDAGLDVVVALAEGIGDNLPAIGETVLSIAGNIYDYVTSEDFLPKIKDAGEEILKTLAEGIKNTIPALGGVLDGLVDNFDALVGVLEAGTAAFIAYKSAMAIGSVVQTATTAIEAMSAAQWGLNAALEANPIGLVVAALAGLGVAVHNVVFNMKGADDEIKSLTDDISALAEETGTALENLDNLTERERNVLEKDIGDSVEKAKANMQDAVAEISEGYFSYYENVLGDSENALKDFAEKYKDVVEDTGEGFVFNFTGTEDIKYVQTVLGDLMTAIEDTGEEAGELSTMYSFIFEASTQLKDAADNIDYLIDAQNRLANYQAPKGTGAKFIPTEASRQMQGKEAPAISVLGAASDTEGFNSTLNNLVESAETAGAKVKEALTFDYKDFGNYANLGVVERLGQALTEEQEKASKIAAQVFSRDQDEISRLTKTQDLSITQQISLWKKAQAQYITGSKQFIEAGDKIANLEKKQTENLEKENEKREKALEKYKDEAEKIYKSIENIEQKYAEKLEQRTNDIFNSYSLFEQVPDRIAVSGKDLMDNLQNQVLSMEKFYGDIQKLKARGVSDALVQEIQGMGVKAIDQLDALLALSDEDLARYNDLYTSKYNLSENIATGQLEDVRKETDAEIEKLYDDIKKLGNDTAENLGLSFMEQFALGIKGGAGKILDAFGEVFGIGSTALGAASTASTMYDIASSGSYVQQADYSSQRDKQTSASNGNSTKVTVNINGIQYQNHTQLVNAVTEEIQRQMTREVNYGRA